MLENYSFHRLIYLKTLHLHANNVDLQINTNTFVELESIQTISVSAPILSSNLTKQIFINMFQYKNRLSKTILKRSYYKSLFLDAIYTDGNYECERTHYFIRHNVHFNFKTEADIHDYFWSCSQTRLENDFLNSPKTLLVTSRHKVIFSNPVLYLAIVNILFVLWVVVMLLYK